MPRGGKRQGRSGERYQNRTDLQMGTRLPVQTGPSQQYGDRVASERQQQAPPVAAPSPGPSAPARTPLAPLPQELPALDAPTGSPNEPLTTGSTYGSGAGPEALGLAPRRLSELLDRLPETGDLADLRVFARQRGL